jgi:predicted Zn-dependent protease
LGTVGFVVRDPKRKKRLATIGTVLAIGLGAFFLAIPLLSGVLAKLVPASVEAKIGEQMMDELAKNGKFCRSEPGLAALDGLVDRLAATTDGKYAFNVYVANDEVLNAFAAPGGHVVIFRGILEEAEKPEEVAGVLAHEMAHVTEGHPRRGMVQALGYGVFRLITPGDDNIGAELVKSAFANRYSRDDELEADRTGVGMLNAAGIDSRGLTVFFDRLSAKGQEIPGALEFLSTHPSGETRKAELDGLTQAGAPALTDEEWAALKAACQDTGEPKAVGTAI